MAAIPVIVATESPVRVYDKARKRVVNEVLLMSGAELPKQVPMLDEHEDNSLRSLVGSIRSFNIVNDELRAYSHFSSRQSAQDIERDVVEGHVTDMSVGAERLEEVYIDSNESKRVAGRVFTGPARIVTRWRPFHGAVVNRGADERSVFMPPSTRAHADADAQFVEHLQWLGMPEGCSEREVIDWIEENITIRTLE